MTPNPKRKTDIVRVDRIKERPDSGYYQNLPTDSATNQFSS